MRPLSIFIGLVSHDKTAFASSQGDLGLAAQLSRAFRDANVECAVAINTKNAYTSTGQVPTTAQVRKGFRAELRVEWKWKRYLGGSHGFRTRLEQILRWGKSEYRCFVSPDTLKVTRLRNIEESHIELFRMGIDSLADWVLILEDDAYSDSVDDLVKGLIGLMENCDADFINLSNSYSMEELGVKHLLMPDQKVRWQGPLARNVLTSDLPVTNTVCAMLYRRDFLQRLLILLKELPTEPVVPIDWRINMVFMKQRVKSTSPNIGCLFVDPAPIDQLSMRRRPLS